jgi:hypothetical protein
VNNQTAAKNVVMTWPNGWEVIGSLGWPAQGSKMWRCPVRIGGLTGEVWRENGRFGVYSPRTERKARNFSTVWGVEGYLEFLWRREASLALKELLPSHPLLMAPAPRALPNLAEVPSLAVQVAKALAGEFMRRMGLKCQWAIGDSVRIGDDLFLKNEDSVISLNFLPSTNGRKYKPAVKVGEVAYVELRPGKRYGWTMCRDWLEVIQRAELCQAGKPWPQRARGWSELGMYRGGARWPVAA